MHFKLDPDFKAAWLAALRSGNYRQGKFKLRKPDDRDPDTQLFCCLGVACDITGEPTAELALPLRSSVAKWYDCDEELLPCDGEFTLTVKASAFAVTFNDAETDLAALNDDGLSFSKIANIIEEQL